MLSKIKSSRRFDWLRVSLLLNENELPTLPHLSNEQILDSIVGQFSFEDESSSNEEDEGQDEEIFSNSEAVERFKKCLL